MGHERRRDSLVQEGSTLEVEIMARGAMSARPSCFRVHNPAFKGIWRAARILSVYSTQPICLTIDGLSLEGQGGIAR
jgi:hypothetical protein